ncbi:MAG: Rpn family recombination-promoting nuclease/putative transposase [Polyangiaceae bacterium]|nr:Rpn family recombination-promoting nuclease/putative transposase [Polyangiaceae bacterium]
MVTKKSSQGGVDQKRKNANPAAPHNNFFAYIFGQKKHAIGLLRAILPAELTRRLNWNLLRREPVSYVDSRLRWLHSDLLFSVPLLDTGQPVLVYILVEHQRRVDPLMAYRVLQYLARVWGDFLKKHKNAASSGRLPLVIPVVIYNGRAPWTAGRSLRESFNAPADLLDAVDKFLPKLEFSLIHLQEKQAAQVVDEMLTAIGRVSLWAMEVADDDQRVLHEIGRLSALLGAMTKEPDSTGALAALLRYILATHERIDRSKLESALTDAFDEAQGEQVVTVYEQLIEEGRQKGLKQGVAKGRAEGVAEGVAKGVAKGRATMLLDLMAAKFGRLPRATKERVEKGTDAELLSWGLRVLTANTMDEVFGPMEAPPAAPKRAPSRSTHRAKKRTG